MRKFEELPNKIKEISKFNQYLMYDLTRMGISNQYEQYRDFRYWFVDQMINYEIDFKSIPVVNRKNQKAVLEECRKKIDLVSLKMMDSNKFEYGIDYINHKYTAVKLDA